MKRCHQLLVLFPILLFSTRQKTTSTSLPLTSIPPLPSTIRADSISHSYPETLISKLFSSVPKRSLAVDNIHLDLKPFRDNDDSRIIGGITLLVGASASGKSTILRFLSGEETPNHGNIYINNKCVLNQNNLSFNLVRPIILERKPDYDDSRSVTEWMVHTGLNSVKKVLKTDADVSSLTSILKTLAIDFCNILEMDHEMIKCKPSSLSPSKQYLFGIACSCMKSVAAAACITTISNKNKNDIMENGIHYPILIFDELFDSEHSDIPTLLKNSLLNLTGAGGLILVATHKPQQLESIAKRIITLTSGKVLSDVLV